MANRVEQAHQRTELSYSIIPLRDPRRILPAFTNERVDRHIVKHCSKVEVELYGKTERATVRKDLDLYLFTMPLLFYERRVRRAAGKAFSRLVKTHY